MDAKIDRLIRNSFKSISSQLIYKLPKRKIIDLQGRNQANTTKEMNTWIPPTRVRGHYRRKTALNLG